MSAATRSHWRLPLAVTVAAGVGRGLANAFYWKKGFPPPPKPMPAAAANY